MSLRRLLPCLMLAALLLAPLGRMGMAEAKAMPHHRAVAMASHCGGQAQPDPGDGKSKMAIDCMIACAAMAPAEAAAFAPPPAAATVPSAIPTSHLAGIRPEADPPPPRFS